VQENTLFGNILTAIGNPCWTTKVELFEYFELIFQPSL